jgi:hypothetical protein
MQTILTYVVAVAVLALFCYMYWPVIVATFQGKGEQPSESSVYVATALAGLIGSVTAMYFEQNYNDIQRSVQTQTQPAVPGSPAPASAPSQPAPAPSAAEKTFGALLRTVDPTAASAQSVTKPVDILKAGFVLVYLITGLAALGAVVTKRKPDGPGGGTPAAPPPAMISNLAFITLGLLVAVAKSLFAS